MKKDYWKRIARLRKNMYLYSWTSYTTSEYPFYKTIKGRMKKVKDDGTIYIY
jgi:hypothetical protein